MPYFLDTVETIPSGVGFSQFGIVHFIWLSVAAFVILLNCALYRKLSDRGRKIWKITVALLILADELFKMSMLFIGRRYTFDYLPLHLCSINIFIILIHAWKPSKLLNGFLYTICIPGALAALLFPSWTALPVGNFMHWHSFTVHILLVLYPVVLSVFGELAPSVKRLHKYFLLLVAMVVPIWLVNILLDTNFMFLMYVDEGNPLYLFEQLWGSHLLGFPVIIAGVLIVMYVPRIVFRIIRKKKYKNFGANA